MRYATHAALATTSSLRRYIHTVISLQFPRGTAGEESELSTKAAGMDDANDETDAAVTPTINVERNI